MWQQAQFCGIQIVTYCVMANHFHILVRVPERRELSDQELLGRAEALYGKQGAMVRLLRGELAQKGVVGRELRAGLVGRMGDVSVYMKELKQRFSRWYNRQSGRFGTLWAERFKSLLVEDEPGALSAVAGYIDLNPVRAGLVEDPKEYRFCGYGEALGGSGRAREGILSVLEAREWAVGARVYRRQLLVGAGSAGRSGKVVLEPERIRKMLAEGGELSVAQALRLRIRYFSDGVVLGSQAYVNEVFAEFRDRFGKRRSSGARRMGGLPFGGLFTLRDLRVLAVG
jgi:REP element-mobilizing transposase RayT